MISESKTYLNGAMFDGTRLLCNYAMTFRQGALAALEPEGAARSEGQVVDLNGDILCPGYVDLQVNGGGGVMFNDDPTVDTIHKITEAHHRLGVVSLLPTLITDTPEKTKAAIAAAIQAVRAGVPGVAGLHLEGPHLSVARKGAHDGALIRPMKDADLAALIAAASELPCLKVTLAPESVSEQQVQALSDAGVLVSLGHSGANFETCQRYAAAGARCVTHLFNAMSQLGSREPGLVGAALATGQLSAGLIADGIHVHPETIRAAWAAKTAPGQIFLVSDAMAVAGTDQSAFKLEGRRITRTDGRLTLEDGTLAGADLDLTTAIGTLVNRAGVPLQDALAAATTYPAILIGQPVAQPLRAESMIRISADLDSCSWLCE
ncbi:N-acetylglucosamine-6-phosphate deacetylase [Ruegeria denitrificans]|uniref:N-acetylglucosamine-6-phosphate deacetylase n=1 Tax=Ruegeria denitrificans TaxID=1715692 RepID=A0A0P1I250_9RHOB|nr:N-acetylglucosamine-6-phosphate deacetylase [Ruegeria denitrificans]CUJ85385.1 N-acetylglucosamine-6-phosphate deacetylase [Ruegeria denitrificans]